MDERNHVADLIDRIVRDARLARQRDRDELRRELESHFAEAEESPTTLRTAIDRFGDPADIGGALWIIHRRTPAMRNALRLTAAIIASAIVAFVLQLATSLYVDSRSHAVRISPFFVRSVTFSGLIIAMLVLAWELDVASLCTRLERHPVRLALVLATLAASMLLFHLATNTVLLPVTALLASAVDVAIWASTVAILARTDRFFARVFTPLHR
jgi:hypothetical protein